MHRRRWRIPSTEVELSTHLTIAYTAPGTASGTPAVAGGTAAAAGEAQGNNPLGFLAALVDQLLAGSAAQAASTPTSGAADTKATPPTPAGTPSVPNLLDVSLGARTGKTAGTPGANVLLATLAAELKTLEQQMANGGQPDPALLQKLGETADALAALIAKPSGSSAAPASTAVSLDPLTTIKSATAGKDDKPKPAVPDTGTAPASTLSDQLAQLLASIGIQVPAATTTAPAAVPTTDTTAVSSASAATAPPLPAIAQLATQLAELGQAVAPSAPDFAQ